MSVLNNSNAIESGGYNIDRSLRFRSSASAYLNRTPASAGNRKTWTWSGWVKRGALGVQTYLFGSNPSGATYIRFNANDTLEFYSFSGSYLFDLITTQVFRDSSAWYHLAFILDTTNATVANRARIYVNGAQVTALSTASYPSLNASFDVNNTNIHSMMAYYGPSNYVDGYLAEVNFIDGQALTPSSFGQTDAVTGVWTPKKYTGTYGTNGFYLDFKDNTSATTLAYDKSGNGNNWTPNNISTTAGATYDSMTDVPTLTSANAANYCVLNPVWLLSSSAPSITNANLQVTSTSSGDSVIGGTIGMTGSGKYYAEFTAGTNSIYGDVGIINITHPVSTAIGNTSTSYNYRSNGNKGNNSTQTSYGASYTTNDVIGVALDLDAGTLTFYKNNTSQGTAFTGISASNTYAFACGDELGAGSFTWTANFGQRPFSFSAPTGFKALNTFNLPDPVIKKPNQYMQVDTYQGSGTARDINLGMQPDLVWIKSRTSVESNNLFDSVRGSAGNYKTLQSNTTGAEITPGIAMVTALNSNGFSLGTNAGVNGSPEQFVAWCWKKGATSGFDIVTSTLPTTGINTLSHSLGVAPKMIIAKRRDGAEAWLVYQSSGTTQSQYLRLNATDAVAASANLWGSSPISSSQFYFNGTSGWQYVFYLFAEIPQFSKAFSFTGNASTDGSFVHLGFKPKAVLLKCSSTTGNWYLFDTVRNTYNVLGEQLYPNLSNAGSTITTLDALSNGFKMRLTGDPNAAQTYIGFAWADSPSKYSNAF